MNDQMKEYLLYGIAVLTLINSYFVFTSGSKSGRVIETPSTNTALVESSRNEPQANMNVGQSNSFDVPTGVTEPINPEPVQKPSGPPTTIAFNEMEHNFGTINQNSENTHIFSFTNTGSNPLIIQDAKGSCGCTVPKYPKEPVGPGETGEIEVVYKPGTQQGKQAKTVTLTANTEPNQTVLQINAMVEKEDS